MVYMTKNRICRFSLLALICWYAALPSGGAEPADTSPPFRGKAGLQLYSLRNQFKKDGLTALDYATEQGFKEVELGLLNPYGFSKEEMKDALLKRGLKPIAGMAPYDELLNKTDKVIETAKFFNVKYVGVSWAARKVPWDETQVLKVAEDFNTIGKRLKENGLQFFFHNHGYEFQPYGDNETLFDLLMQKTDPELVKLEMDVLWTVLPGQDPVKLLKKYPDRWILMHLKELAHGIPKGNLTGRGGPQIETAIGSGQTDYPAVLKTALEVGVKHFFIEDETPDVLNQIPKSLEFLNNVTF